MFHSAVKKALIGPQAKGFTALCAVLLTHSLTHATVVAEWNETALAEVRNSKLGPPATARALAIAHTCMYDAWAAYNKAALGAVTADRLRQPSSERTNANREKAISHAAYNCLLNLYPAGAQRLRAAMLAQGHNPDDQRLSTTDAAGVGNTVAQAVIASRRNDGSNQYGTLASGAYADYTGYAPRNQPAGFCMPQMVCSPLVVADPLHWQPLINDAGVLQKFISPHWGRVQPFALTSGSALDDMQVIKDTPRIQDGNAVHYRKQVENIISYSAKLTPAEKLIVEYWADGPASELPPGHWGVFAQFVSQRDNHSIAKDAKMFFALHNATMDAGIVAWHLKRKFDGVRPITAVRYLKQGTAITAWGGPGRPIEQIQGEKWTPYNPGSNLTPAFAGYVSGHSTFSAAAATVLKKFTGSDAFNYSIVVPANFGRVEPGVPLVPTTIKFKKFSDAADEAGLSRLLGGIHFKDDNTVGQALGQEIGKRAWDKAQGLFKNSDD